MICRCKSVGWGDLMPDFISHEILIRRLDYDPDTGFFTWKHAPNAWKGWNEKFAGKRAGCFSRGYWLIRLEGRIYRASRLAWFYVMGQWPQTQIDHVNGDSLDDRFSNLRDASPSENTCNRKLQSNNTSGFKGVYWLKANKKWRVRVGVGGKDHHIGLFDDQLSAALAYDRAAKELQGEYAKTNKTLGRL